jgi:hypothetical protein
VNNPDAQVAEAVARGRTAGRHVLEARLVGCIDALFDIGGPGTCLHIIAIMTERVAERMRLALVRGAISAQDSGWVE